jgi:hypothetical protein
MIDDSPVEKSPELASTLGVSLQSTCGKGKRADS